MRASQNTDAKSRRRCSRPITASAARIRPRSLGGRLALAVGMLLASFAVCPVQAQDYDYSAYPAPIPWTSYATIIIAIVVYFIPSMVAFWRRHPNRWPILGINILFGGTGLGWIGALIWALHAAHLSETGSDGGESGLNLFVNDVKTIRMEPARSDASTTANEPLGDLHSRASGPNAGRTSSSGPIEPNDSAGQALAQLQRLKSLLDAGVITAEEYGRMRAPLLAKAMGE
jgi:hypothetical protein